MAEQQEASGSPVNQDDESTGDQQTQSASRQVDSGVPQLQCPRCKEWINLEVDAAEEMTTHYQDQDQDSTQVLIDEVLKELKQVMPKEVFKSAELVVKNCRHQTSAEKQSLLELLQYDRNLHQKPDKEKKTPSSTTPNYRLYTVKMFSMVTGRTCGAADAILKQVKKVGWSTSVVQISTHPQDGDIILLFCPITSRVGTDVDAAMRQVSALSSGDKPIVLVLMHHTRDPDYSVDKKRWSDTLQNVVLDVHVLFHETLQGLLKCSRNDDAIHQIQNELKKHSKNSYL